MNEVISLVPSVHTAQPAAISLAPQINDAHKACLAAESSALPHAIRCGELLNLARDTVPDRKWLAWLADHCPSIHQTTANEYQRLAKHSKMFKGTALSIRAALKQIPKGPPRVSRRGAAEGASVGKSDRERKSACDVRTENAHANHANAHATIEAALQPLDVDELFDALKGTWEIVKLKALAKRLASYTNEVSQ